VTLSHGTDFFESIYMYTCIERIWITTDDDDDDNDDDDDDDDDDNDDDDDDDDDDEVLWPTVCGAVILTMSGKFFSASSAVAAMYSLT